MHCLRVATRGLGPRASSPPDRRTGSDKTVGPTNQPKPLHVARRARKTSRAPVVVRNSRKTHMLPNEINAAREATSVTGGAHSVLTTYLLFANQEGHAWPSQETVAKRSGVSRSTVARHVKKLRKLGELVRLSHRSRRSTTYLVARAKYGDVASAAYENRENAVGAPKTGAADREPPLERAPNIERRATTCPPDWRPSSERHHWAKSSLGLDDDQIERHVREFVDFWRDKQEKRHDWEVAWCNQIEAWAAKVRPPRRQSGTEQRRPQRQSELERLLSIAQSPEVDIRLRTTAGGTIGDGALDVIEMKGSVK